MDIKKLISSIDRLSEAADFEKSLSTRVEPADFSVKPHEKRGRKVSGSRYGAQDDIDDDGDEKKEKAAPSTKRGRGRPKKHSDTETGEVPKYSFGKELQSFMIGNLPGGKLPGKAGKKHTLSDKDVEKSATKKVKAKLEDWIQHVERSMLAENTTSQPVTLNVQSMTPAQKQAADALARAPGKPGGQQFVSVNGTNTNGTNTNGTIQTTVSEEELAEVAAPGQEQWIKKNKQRFIDQYGKKKGMRVLYAKAWDRSKSKKSVTEGYAPEQENTLLLVLNRFPYEHKMCQQGWGMHGGLYEALCDHYFKEGRISHQDWHGPSDQLRRCVEECYMEDTASEMSEGVIGALAGRAIGTAVGGPVGGALGGIAGSEIQNRLTDDKEDMSEGRFDPSKEFLEKGKFYLVSDYGNGIYHSADEDYASYSDALNIYYGLSGKHQDEYYIAKWDGNKLIPWNDLGQIDEDFDEIINDLDGGGIVDVPSEDDDDYYDDEDEEDNDDKKFNHFDKSNTRDQLYYDREMMDEEMSEDSFPEPTYEDYELEEEMFPAEKASRELGL